MDVALFRGKVDWNEGHIKVENNCVGYKEMKKWLCLKGAEKRQLRVCMESTGLYTHNFRTWLEKEGITYYVVDLKTDAPLCPATEHQGYQTDEE